MPHRLKTPPAAALAERGVYFLPWKGIHGERYLAAVDRQGRRIVEATVFPGVDSRPVERMLWDVLDREDPPPPRIQILP
jgi:hypothetical protein